MATVLELLQRTESKLPSELSQVLSLGVMRVIMVQP